MSSTGNPRPEPVTAPLPSEACPVRVVLREEWPSITEKDRHGWWDGLYVRLPAGSWSAAEVASWTRLVPEPAADQRARDEGTVREEIAREIEADMNHDAVRNATLATAARIARGGTR